MVASAYLPCWRYRFPLSKNFFFSVLASREHPVVMRKQMARRIAVICWHRVFIQIPFRGRQTLRRADWLSRNARSVTEAGEHRLLSKIIMDWSALKSPRKWSAWSLKDYGRLQVWRRPHIWFEFRVSADLNPATLGLSPVASAQQCCQTNHAEPHNRQAPRLGDIWRRRLRAT